MSGDDRLAGARAALERHLASQPDPGSPRDSGRIDAFMEAIDFLNFYWASTEGSIPSFVTFEMWRDPHSQWRHGSGGA